MRVSRAIGEILVVLPGESPSHWQPVPANGSVEVLVAPNRVPMEMPFGFGTHTIRPGVMFASTATSATIMSSTFSTATAAR